MIHKKKTCWKTCWKICWKICWDLLHWENGNFGVVGTCLRIKFPFQQIFQQVFQQIFFLWITPLISPCSFPGSAPHPAVTRRRLQRQERLLVLGRGGHQAVDGGGGALAPPALEASSLAKKRNTFSFWLLHHIRARSERIFRNELPSQLDGETWLRR